MANVTFSNTSPVDTNLQNINQANITDATAAGYTFLGVIGTNLTVDAQDAVVAISNGECTVVGSGTPTYVAIKGTGGELGLYQNPQI